MRSNIKNNSILDGLYLNRRALSESIEGKANLLTDAEEKLLSVYSEKYGIDCKIKQTRGKQLAIDIIPNYAKTPDFTIVRLADDKYLIKSKYGNRNSSSLEDAMKEVTKAKRVVKNMLGESIVIHSQSIAEAKESSEVYVTTGKLPATDSNEVTKNVPTGKELTDVSYDKSSSEYTFRFKGKTLVSKGADFEKNTEKKSTDTESVKEGTVFEGLTNIETIDSINQKMKDIVSRGESYKGYTAKCTKEFSNAVDKLEVGSIITFVYKDGKTKEFTKVSDTKLQDSNGASFSISVIADAYVGSSYGNIVHSAITVSGNAKADNKVAQEIEDVFRSESAKIKLGENKSLTTSLRSILSTSSSKAERLTPSGKKKIRELLKNSMNIGDMLLIVKAFEKTKKVQAFVLTKAEDGTFVDSKHGKYFDITVTDGILKFRPQEILVKVYQKGNKKSVISDIQKDVYSKSDEGVQGEIVGLSIDKDNENNEGTDVSGVSTPSGGLQKTKQKCPKCGGTSVKVLRSDNNTYICNECDNKWTLARTDESLKISKKNGREYICGIEFRVSYFKGKDKLSTCAMWGNVDTLCISDPRGGFWNELFYTLGNNNQEISVLWERIISTLNEDSTLDDVLNLVKKCGVTIVRHDNHEHTEKVYFKGRPTVELRNIMKQEIYAKTDESVKYKKGQRYVTDDMMYFVVKKVNKDGTVLVYDEDIEKEYECDIADLETLNPIPVKN